jgi:hypothetical protein
MGQDACGAARAKLIGRLGELAGVKVRQHKPRAFRRQPLGDGQTDPAACAGDKRGLAGKAPTCGRHRI